METKSHKSIQIKNGSVNDRPLFMQNSNGSYSSSAEINEFRRALPQFLAVSVKNTLLFVYGMTLGFPTIVIPAIQGGEGREPSSSEIVLNRDEISWFSSINLICVPLGCLFSGAISQPLGKRRAMQFVNLPILASWLLFNFATKTEHLYVALCLSGLGGGLMEAPVLTYVAEITEPKYRGILSALGSTCVITGIFIQFIMGSIMDWRTIAAVSSAFPVISIVLLCFVPESPTWLIREQRFREAVKALQWLRGWVPEHKIEAEFNQLYDDLITRPAAEEAAEINATGVKPSRCTMRMRMFRKRSFIAPFILVAFTFFVGHFSGKTTLQTYAVQIFHTLKAPINKYHATILLGIAEMVATIMCVFLIHFTGKRFLVLTSAIGVGLCLFGTATYAHYVKVLPGFAVNNVVTNASTIVSKESIISQQNITDIFESAEKALRSSIDADLPHELNKINITTTTIYTPYDDITTLLSTLQNAENRTKRQTDKLSFEAYKRFEPEDYNDNLTYIDLSSLDYNTDSNDTHRNVTELIDLLDSEEEQDGIATTTEHLLPAATTEQAVTTYAPKKADLKELKQPEQSNQADQQVKQVVDEILLTVPKQKRSKLVWIPLILLLGSAFFAHFGIRMIPWILIGEVFPAPVRSTASGLVSGLGYIFGFLANKLFLNMLATLTFPGTFWLYSAVALSGAFILYFTLPETEGRTLAEIEAHFSKKSDLNLLSKESKKTYRIRGKKDKKEDMDDKPMQMDNLQNLHIPINASTEAKIIQLQQSDLTPNIRGETNLAFEENSTTHL